MKIQLLTAAVILALTSTTAFAGKSHGTTVSNKSKNAVAIGGEDARAHASSEGKHGFTETLTGAGGRAVAGSIYLTGDACACDFKSLKNRSRGSIAIGNATAGSIQVSTMASKGGPR